MEKAHTSRSIWIYLFITFSLAVLLSFSISLTGGHTSKWINLAYLAMFIPAVAVLVLRLLKVSSLIVEWQRFPLEWIPGALFIFPVIIHAVCLPLVAWQNNGEIPWQSWLSVGIDGIFHTPLNKNWGDLTWPELVIRIALNAVTGLLIVSFLAFFEEIGWRAWLLPKLIERFDIKKGIFATALICALWHLPYSLSGIHHVADMPLYYSVPLEFFGQIGVAIIFSWLWIRTQSIWMVSIAHGSLNNWGQYAFKFMDDTSSASQTLSLFIALNLSLFLSGLIILFSLKKRK